MSNESRKERPMREGQGNEQAPSLRAETLLRAMLIVAVLAVAGFTSGGIGAAETPAQASVQGG